MEENTVVGEEVGTPGSVHDLQDSPVIVRAEFTDAQELINM